MLPTLYFPIEIGTRELEARLLTACIAAEREFTVALGFQHNLILSAPKMPPGIYFSKGTNDAFMAVAMDMHACGHYFVACEEENFGFSLASNPLTFNSSKLADHCDLYLGMGQDEADYLARRYGNKIPVAITGNARVDVLRPKLRGMFEAATAEIKKRYGRFTLINSNFGLINSAGGASVEQHFTDWTNLGIFANKKEVHKNAAEFNHFIEWENNNAIALRTLIAMLAKEDGQIIIRPHPTEKAKTWVDIVNELGASNIRVLEGTPYIPFMLAADLVIHPGCTTGLEAIMLGVPVISLQIGNSPVNDYYLSNKVNLNYPDASRAFVAVERHFRGDPFITEARQSLLNKLTEYLDGAGSEVLSAEKIIDALETFATTRFPTSLPKSNLRNVQWASSPTSTNAYTLQKFNVSREMVDTGLRRLQTTLNRFSKVKIEPIADMIYLIHA